LDGWAVVLGGVTIALYNPPISSAGSFVYHWRLLADSTLVLCLAWVLQGRGVRGSDKKTLLLNLKLGSSLLKPIM
jgi:hypothetical protein